MKIKWTINLLIIGLALFACNNTNNDKKMTDNKIYYAINYDTNIPYEIFVNGISVARSYNLKGQEGGYRILNPFIEKSGIQNVSVKLLVNGESKLTKDVLARQKFELYTFDDIDNPQKISLLKKLIIDDISIKQKLLTTSFDAKVNYKFSNNLETASDLTKQDSIKLLEECKAFYVQISSTINEGNQSKYKDVIKNSIDREVSSLYYTKEQESTFLKSIDNRIINSKGHLIPLRNFSLKIHPNKKIMSLVDENGNTPLIFSDGNKENKFSFLLYKKDSLSPIMVY